MRRFRQGARPRRTRCGTVREGNEAGADAVALECRDLRKWPPGDRSADLRVHRKSSDFAKEPPPKMRKPAKMPRNRGAYVALAAGGEEFLGTSLF
jgi:hypothetical protein